MVLTAARRAPALASVVLVPLLLASAPADAKAPATHRTAAAAAPTTAFSFTSQPGEYVGGGRSMSFTPPAAQFSVTGNAGRAIIHVQQGTESWQVTLAAPRGDVLRPGVYHDAEQADQRTGRAPGIDVYDIPNVRSCLPCYGTVAVNQIGTDGSGNVNLVDATFVLSESPSGPTLTGAVLYQALPLSYEQQGDPNDWVSFGVHKTYVNSSSAFTMTGTVTSVVRFTASGLRDSWEVDLAPVSGQTLTVGTYTDAQRTPFRAAGHPGIDAYGDGRGCNQVAGSFTVLDIGTDAAGNVTNLSATFEQHCDGLAAALRGTIHYLA
jgi:hypothetical protein